MKKMLLISIALTMLMIFAACQNTIKDTNSTGNAPLYTQTVTAPVNPQAEATMSENAPLYTQTITVQAAYKWPETLDDVVNGAYNIFIGNAEKILPAERVNVQEIGYTNITDQYQNFTPVQVKVIKAIKGPVKDDMTLNISLNGGIAGGINVIYGGEYGLEEGKTYLFFVTGRDTTKKECYRLAVPYRPSPQIVDGKLVDYAENAFHLPSGLTIDEIVQKINEVAK